MKISHDELKQHGIGVGAKHASNNTTIGSVNQAQKTPRLNALDKRIVEVIGRLGEATIYDIAKALGYSVSLWLRGRVNKLHDRGLLWRSERYHRTNRTKFVYGVCND
jgi:hypothetical protein